MEGIGAIPPRPAPAGAPEILALGAALRQAREQAAALVQLVEPAPAGDGRGRYVDTRA